MTAALIIAGALLSFYFGVRAIRSTGALPVWRFKRAPAVTPMDPIERARILATPVEELAEEIALRREMEAPGYVAPPCGCYLCKKRRMPAVLPSRAVEMATLIQVRVCASDTCQGTMFSSLNLRRSICGRCGRVVDWETLRA